MHFDVISHWHLCVVSTKQRSQCGCWIRYGPGSGVCVSESNVCAATPIFLHKQTNKKTLIHFALKKTHNVL